MAQVIHFSSDPPQSPFAPQWDYVIAEKETKVDVEELAKLILSKEEEIKEKYPDDWDHYDDGDTGLGADSLTARFNYFNVLDWDSPACKELHKEIKDFHDLYVQNTVASPEGGDIGVGQKYYDSPFFKDGGELKVRCWANVMRKGQQIKEHSHSSFPHSYLSGHFTVQCDNTETVYHHPYHQQTYPFKNIPNVMTLFPTWVPHSTTVHESDTPRITIAFDILLHNTPKSDGELVTL